MCGAPLHRFPAPPSSKALPLIEAMAERVMGRAVARGDAELGIDRRQMGIDRAGRTTLTGEMQGFPILINREPKLTSIQAKGVFSHALRAFR